VATTLLVTTAGILLALPHLQVLQLRGWAMRKRVPTWMRAS
jgi:hypothetical protein